MTALELFWERCEGSILYGHNDCCITLADVIVAAGGPDLMAQYRGRYKTRLGFVRAYRKVGHRSLDDAAAAEFERFGHEADLPRDFDVAIVSYADGSKRQISPAFFHSGFWCLRSERGMMASKGAPEKIWRVINA